MVYFISVHRMLQQPAVLSPFPSFARQLTGLFTLAKYSTSILLVLETSRPPPSSTVDLHLVDASFLGLLMAYDVHKNL